MVQLIIVGISCLLVGFLVSLLIKTTKVKEKNQQIEREEQQLQLAIKDAERDYDNLINKIIQEQQRQEQILKEDYYKWEEKKNQQNLSFLQAELKLKENIAGLESQIEEKKNLLLELDNQSKQAVKLVEEQVMDNMSNTIEQQGKELVQHYEKLESNLLLHYTNLADSKQDEYITNAEILDNQILAKENELSNLTAKAAAITEVNRKAELEKQEKDFYRLQLSDIDIEEIKKIRSIEPYLRKKEPLNKVIWKVYYEKPYLDLIGRVIGSEVKCGVYKITHIDSGKCYVGQSNNIAERWRQHIKRGVGADIPTQNKLYPAMLELGAENFMFEIIEECPVNILTEREKYYTDIFSAQSFGFVTKKG